MFSCCPVKACVKSNNYSTCADCKEFSDLKRCKKLHNFVSIIFGMIFRSNRIGKLYRIREIGLDSYKDEMRKEGSK